MASFIPRTLRQLRDVVAASLTAGEVLAVDDDGNIVSRPEADTAAVAGLAAHVAATDPHAGYVLDADLATALDTNLTTLSGADEHETEVLIQPAAALTANAEYPVFRAPFPCQILSVAVTNQGATVAADDTNYWKPGLRRRYARGNLSAGFGATYQERVIRDAPIRYWPLQETSGTVATDAMGVTNGTYTGGVTLAQPGPAGLDAELAASFDGVDDYVALPSETWPLGQQPGYEAWVNLGKIANATGANRQMLIGAENGAGVPALEMGGLAQSAYGNGPAVLATGISGFLISVGDWINLKWAINEWHYVAYWRDAGGVDHLCMNGVELPFFGSSTPGAAFTNTATAHALGRRAAGSQFLQGLMAHAAVYAGNFSLAKAQAHWDFHTAFGLRTTRVDIGGPLTQYQPVTFGAYPWRTSHYKFDQGDVLALGLKPVGAPTSIAGPLLASVRYGRL